MTSIPRGQLFLFAFPSLLDSGLLRRIESRFAQLEGGLLDKPARVLGISHATYDKQGIYVTENNVVSNAILHIAWDGRRPKYSLHVIAGDNLEKFKVEYADCDGQRNKILEEHYSAIPLQDIATFSEGSRAIFEMSSYLHQIHGHQFPGYPRYLHETCLVIARHVL